MGVGIVGRLDGTNVGNDGTKPVVGIKSYAFGSIDPVSVPALFLFFFFFFLFFFFFFFSGGASSSSISG